MKTVFGVFTVLLGLGYWSSASAALIAVSLTRFDDNYLNVLRSNIESAVDQTGNDVYIDSAYNDPIKQVEQVKEFAAAKVDAIIVNAVTSNKENAQQMIKAAQDNQVPLVFLNTMPDIASLPANVIYVGSNEEESGTMEMEELAKKAHYKGKVAMLMGESDHPAAQTRSLDVETVLKRYPDMSLIVKDHANWQRNTALSVTSKWLKTYKNDINIIVANNDEMALGAILAIEEANLDPKDFLIGGIDGTADALQSIKEGKLAVSVLQDAVGQAKSSVDTALRLIHGETLPSKVWVPFKLIIPENLNQYLK